MPLKSAELFGKMKPHLETHGAKIVEQVKAVYCFEIRENKDAQPVTFTIDLKNGKGKIAEGTIEGLKPDCTFVMLDEDFLQLASGKLKPQQAFMGVSIQLARI